MSIQQQARALMVRHQNSVHHRQQCLMSRAATGIGLSQRAVDRWMHSRGKARMTSVIDGTNHASMS